MITIADLNGLRDAPQVAYDGYDELRGAARRRNGGFADPADIPRMHNVIRSRGVDWCRAVLGWPMNGDLQCISLADAEMLLVADERGLDPPLPGWLVQWKAETAEMQRARNEAREQAARRDRDRWAAALADCQAPVYVRPNLTSRQVRGGRRERLRHVVPAVDARSPKRRHLAGRALCETAGRAKPLVLGDPVDDPATCVSCIAYTAVIRPAEDR